MMFERGDRMKDDQKNWPLTAQVIMILRALFILAAVVIFAYGMNVPHAEEDAAPAIAQTGEQRWVVPLGRTVGIKLFSDGVMVVGLSEIATGSGAASPANDCGLRTGDIITHINSEEVDTIEDVQSMLQDIAGEKMSIRVLREDKQIQLTAQAVQCSTDDAFKLGAWIRDSMAGIGTTTFYDPDSGVFGALGHGITDIDTALLMPLQSGSIMYASVSSIKKGIGGQPGELQGMFEVNKDMGELYANTGSGIFGILSDKSLAGSMQAVPVADRSEVKVGPAVILSNIEGNTVEEYTVDIIRVYPRSDEGTRDLMIKVTDARLLRTTGGIVQGMSGSPILQNGRLVGAVTHVLVNDPAQGYGILAQTMLSQAKIPLDAHAA